jgi:WD40 repeat protein
MESPDPTDRLQDYLDGVVSGPEEHVLENRLKSDPLFAERLVQLGMEEAVLKEWAGTAAVALPTSDGRSPLLQDLNALAPELPNMEAPGTTDTQPRRKRWRRLAIAGGCLLLLAGLVGIVHLVEPRALPALKELLFPSPPPPQGDPIATLEDAIGDVTYFSRWDEDFKAKGGTALFAWEKIQTSPLSGLATVRYPDGTSVQLATDTTVQLQVDDEPNTKHIDLKEGFLTVDVPRPGDGRQLIVSTPHAEIKVLAAHFTCLSTTKTTTVETEEGSVEMVRLVGGRPVAGQPPVKVEGGFYAVAAKDAEALVAHKMAVLQIKQPRKVISDATGPILALAYAPNGKSFATGGWDGTVLIWGPITGEVIGTLRRGQKTPVRCLAFFPKELIACGGDRRVRVWEIDREQVYRVLPDQESDVNELTVSPDGKWLATAILRREGNSVVKLWESLVETQSIQRSSQTAPCLAFSPDSKALVAGYDDGRIVLWSVPECKKLATFKAHESDVRALRFNARGDRLASAGRDRTAKVWRWQPGKGEQRFKIEREFTGHGSEVRGIAFSADGLLLGTAGTDGTARLWDIASGREIATFLHRGYGVTSVAFTADGKQLVSAGWNKTIKFWDLPEPAQE